MQEKKGSLVGLYILGTILLIGISSIFYLYSTPPTIKTRTLQQLEEVAESSNPYLPEGYMIIKKAELVQLGTTHAYQTVISDGNHIIRISIKPISKIDCAGQTKQHGIKPLCISMSEGIRSVEFITDSATIAVTSDSKDVGYDLLERIAESL